MDVTNFIVRVSSKCNLGCHYCFARHDFTGTAMTKEMLEHVIREIDSLGLASVQMSWHGGEPLLLGLDLFKYGVDVQKSLKTVFCNTVQTNGTLVSDVYADFFAENNFGVGISLDGYEEVQNINRPYRNNRGSFRSAVDGLKRLLDRLLDVSCISVISDFCDPVRYFEFVKGLGISDFTMKPCTGKWERSMGLEEYTGFVGEVYRLLASTDEDLPECREFMGYAENILSGTSIANLCSQSGRCGHFALIDVNGDVFPCDELTSSEFFWGNITRMSLAETLCSTERKSFLDRVNLQNKTCRQSCEVFDACQGGCTSCHLQFEKEKYCAFQRTTIGDVRKMVSEGVDSWLDPEDENVKQLVDPRLLGQDLETVGRPIKGKEV